MSTNADDSKNSSPNHAQTDTNQPDDSVPVDLTQHVIRAPGPDCEFYYARRDGQLVERAVFDDGRVGAEYPATPAIIPSPDEDGVVVLDESSWPTHEGAT